jgi:hypothetical protein
MAGSAGLHLVLALSDLSALALLINVSMIFGCLLCLSQSHRYPCARTWRMGIAMTIVMFLVHWITNLPGHHTGVASHHGQTETNLEAAALVETLSLMHGVLPGTFVVAAVCHGVLLIMSGLHRSTLKHS